MTRDTSSTAYALIRLRVLHPFISLAVGLGVSLLTLRLVLPAAPPHPARRAATWVLALTLGQLACGALNVWLKAPVWMQLVHLLLADLVWIAFVLMAAVTFGLRARDTLPPPAWLAVAQGPPTPPH